MSNIHFYLSVSKRLHNMEYVPGPVLGTGVNAVKRKSLLSKSFYVG